MNEVTHIFDRVQQGDPKAAEELLPLVYEELRKLAAHKMACEAPGQTLQATALVHEAWLRLGGDRQTPWRSRAHFFAAAAEAMRRILVDRARLKRAQRRGGGAEHVNVHEIEVASPDSDDQLLALNEALDRFAAQEPQKADLVKLRYFAGLKIVEVAEVLCISEATAKRWWVYARAWLFEELRGA